MLVGQAGCALFGYVTHDMGGKDFSLDVAKAIADYASS
jgi:hypothetical protein